jgi:nanoRNase/pAp phosphatase (c-di-AMP/oligoRNAs hydrolase)
MSLHNLETITKEIKKASKAVILPHVSADGDAVGSALALCAT